MKFSAEFISALEDRSRTEAVEAMAQTLHGLYSDYYAALDVDAERLIPFCADVEAWAFHHSIRTLRDVSKLCVVAQALGHHFWTDRRFLRFVETTLADRSLAVGGHAREITRTTQTWLDGIWARDSLSTFGTRLCDAVETGQEPNEAILHAILPQHWAILGQDKTVNWLKDIYISLPKTDAPAQRVALMGAALVHGQTWWQDPQYHVLSRAILNERAELHVVLREIYGRIG